MPSPRPSPIVLAALLAAGCNAVAGLGDYTEAPATTGPSGTSGTSGTGGTSGTSGTSGPSGTDAGTVVVDGAVVDAQPFDSGAVTITDTGVKCVPCGTDCCVVGTAAPHCLNNNTCGACSPPNTTCTGDRDCCGGYRCAAPTTPTAGLCKQSCLSQFTPCGGGISCCLGLACKRGELTGVYFCATP